MNYLLAALIGVALGFLIPKVFKKIEWGLFTSLAVGGGSALVAFHVIFFAGIYPKGAWGVILTALTGVFFAVINVKPYFIPKFPPLTLVVRIFLGLFMLSSGIMMWIANPQPGQQLPGAQPGPLFDWLQAVIDTGYLWQFIFGFKIVAGILLLMPRTCPIGILCAIPYYASILAYTLFLAQQWLWLSVPAAVATVYLVFAYWDRFEPIILKNKPLLENSKGETNG